ncbi:hypothetical protein [Planctomicrobium sp. SH664]|uniref:hypothetical protein n=1 Tax=Planctomicrobium sp. SH664 TaxID=3448125 RepID=UPI003F5C3401
MSNNAMYSDYLDALRSLGEVDRDTGRFRWNQALVLSDGNPDYDKVCPAFWAALKTAKGWDEGFMTPDRQNKACATLVVVKFLRSEFDGQQVKIVLDGDQRFGRLTDVPNSIVQGNFLLKLFGLDSLDKIRRFSNELFDLLTPAMTFEAYPEVVPELIAYGQEKAIRIVNSELRVERATRWQVLEFCRLPRTRQEVAAECDLTVKKATNEFLFPMVEDGWLKKLNLEAAESVQRFQSANWLQ